MQAVRTNMAENPSRANSYRPLLLALAAALAAAMTLYSVGWMYYSQRSELPVEVGMETDPVGPGLKVKNVWQDSPAQHAGLHAGDVIVALDGQGFPSNGGNRCVDMLYSMWFR